MHFDAQTARAHMPKGLVALMDQAQGAINTEANTVADGVARRTFLKAAAASGFALGAGRWITLDVLSCGKSK